MRKALAILCLLGLAVLAAGWWLTRPRPADPAELAGLAGDATRGESVFLAAGCASCHKAPDSDEARALAGGERFATPFGTFVAPNISPDPTHGIGAWTLADFASAVRNGTSPEGRHYYPAFPYASYARMTAADLADLWAFLGTLPPQDRANERHDLAFPFNIRAGLGLWKALYLDRDWIAAAGSPAVARGRYLVEALGHCGECHTPRTLLGGLDRSRWLAGAPNPAGKGTIPALTPDRLDWSEGDIAYFLETGLTPDFDTAGSSMVEVVKNTARLATEDRAAIAAYLKALPGG